MSEDNRIQVRRDVGDRLRTIRTSYAMTREQLSEVSGAAADTIKGVETGKHLPSVRTLIKLKQAMPDMSVVWLLSGGHDVSVLEDAS